MRLLVLALLIALPAHAFAFSDPALFADGVDKGGGGGRYFTGSRADGYACSVCHEGGATPTFIVDGIPDEPVAGTRYDLVVHWPDAETPHALQLELVGADGSHPSVTAMPPAMLPAASRCEQKIDGAPAIYTFDVGVRRIVGVEDCGAAMVALSFIATGGPIELSIGGITSDNSGTVDGDGSYELRTVIGQKLAATGGGGCSTGGESTGWLATLLAAIMAARGRRAR